MSNLIGKIVSHEGKIYQILKENKNLLFASSYGDDCGIEETILVSKSSGDIIAKKSVYSKNSKIVTKI